MKMQLTHQAQQIKNELLNFSGSEKFYRDRLTQIVWTEGVKFIADNCGSYWLITQIISSQMISKVQTEPFQVHKLHVDLENGHGVYSIEDGNGTLLYCQNTYTDFCLDEITFYYENKTICLPSER